MAKHTHTIRRQQFDRFVELALKGLQITHKSIVT